MADLTIKAMKAGKAVLLEKPASNNGENMRRIVDAAAKSTALLQIGYMMRQGSWSTLRATCWRGSSWAG